MKPRWIATILIALAVAGCSSESPYGYESQLILPGKKRQTWAVAPVINLSGQRQVDAINQADRLFEQLQQVQGVTAIPVNRVAQVYVALHINQIQSEQQAQQICEALGCDGLLVASVTIYDPYNPPKMGGSLQLFRREKVVRASEMVDPRDLSRRGAPPPSVQPAPSDTSLVQVVGIYDAANGTVRQSVLDYAEGRHDPKGPLGAGEYLMDMDRYAGFVYHALLADLMRKPQLSGK